jgi:hypothetical protein
MCKEGCEKSYESGGIPCAKSEIKVLPFSDNRRLVMVEKCLYCWKMNSYICDYITHLHRDNKDKIVYVSAKRLPGDSFAIEHNSILCTFIH